MTSKQNAMTTKLNWGKRVALLYIGFMALIVTLVAGSMRQKLDLVAPDYYAQEIAYQQTIDAGKNQSALSEPVRIRVDQTNVTIGFPVEFQGKETSVDIHFYSPANSSFDKKMKLETYNAEIVIARNVITKTNYKVKLSWMCDNKHYYQETPLNLTKL